MHGIAHGGGGGSERIPLEFSLKANSGRKIPRHTGELNLRQRRAGPVLYQLSYIPTPKTLAVVGEHEVRTWTEVSSAVNT